MNYTIRAVAGPVACASLLTLTGCLTLGGKTTYTSESPETKQQITALETRISVLERVVLGAAPPGSVSTSALGAAPGSAGSGVATNGPANSFR